MKFILRSQTIYRLHKLLEQARNTFHRRVKRGNLSYLKREGFPSFLKNVKSWTNVISVDYKLLFNFWLQSINGNMTRFLAFLLGAKWLLIWLSFQPNPLSSFKVEQLMKALIRSTENYRLSVLVCSDRIHRSCNQFYLMNSFHVKQPILRSQITINQNLIKLISPSNQ